MSKLGSIVAKLFPKQEWQLIYFLITIGVVLIVGAGIMLRFGDGFQYVGCGDWRDCDPK